MYCPARHRALETLAGEGGAARKCAVARNGCAAAGFWCGEFSGLLIAGRPARNKKYLAEIFDEPCPRIGFGIRGIGAMLIFP